MNDLFSEPLVLDAYGCSVVIDLPSRLVPLLLAALPPGYRRGLSDSAAQRGWRVSSAPDGSLQAFADGGVLVTHPDVAFVLEAVLSDIQLWVAEHSPERVFVHAGCVAFEGRALVLPGRTMTGKSTLVSALVGAGATYLSDEYALMDDDGFVWPYARPLSLRSGSQPRMQPLEVSDVVAVPPQGRLPVGMICALRYDPAAGWAVDELSQGEAVLSLIDNSVAARGRPEAVLSSLVAATEDVVAIKGTRDRAEVAAQRLLERASTLGSTGTQAFSSSAL